MINIQFIRDNPDRVSEASSQKGYAVDIPSLLEQDVVRRDLQTQVEALRRERNEIATSMKGQRPTDEQVARGRAVKDQLSDLEQRLTAVDTAFISLLKQVPNMPADDVPVGSTEAENVVSKTVGQPTVFDFTPKSHADIAYAKGWLDKERATKVTGPRFAYLKGDLVKLQFAIVQFVFDRLSDQAFIDQVIAENNLTVSNKVFTPVLPPYLIKTDLYDAMDRLEPRDDRYKLEDEDLWLQGSAEHVLGSMHADEVLPEAEMPIRYIGYATSFRREAGTYGKDMEGIFRMHQFDKLEMESLGLPEVGLQEHLFFVAIQEKIMELLGIPFQVLTKCTADIGKPNARGVDIEAWMPGQQQYRETHTADYMTDYQSRRLKTRVKRADGSIDLIHTNDATALPLSRGPIAIIENFQTVAGDVVIPEVLRPYMGGKTII